MFTTPILLIIFNRPDKVERLINSLRSVKPTKVYVSADGPRENVATDHSRCDRARAVVSQIDWPCEVFTNFHEYNTGADFGPEKAINWFFDNVDEGIILEDDCIAHPDFFRFAKEMLSRYRANDQVMMISGNNFQNEIIRGDGSYYFSKYPSTWGWASWRRAWMHYDTRISGYREFTDRNILDTICQSPAEKKYWTKFFEKINSGELNHWDIKWIFAVWNNNGISITPNVNLVQNIGFGNDATHTFTHDDTMVVRAVELGEITHPSTTIVDKKADAYLFEHVYKFTLIKRFFYLIELIKRRLTR
ncbi:MAG: nucleotide-diphospho-sugar transferase [Candidatus Yonathbacteria bacterium]|nr:nucleotide-diphospho-sugar transferase [Candidatus Yonathbacteria bacterium]